jgi:hypothetical protein
MHGIYTSNLVLWGVQAFLALFFLSASAPKLLGRGLERWTGFSVLSRAQVVFIGATEVLGAAGLVLPMASGVAPWLTPLAAMGLATTVLMAAGFHLRANEYLEAVEALLWASIATTVAIGRWGLVAASIHVSAWTIVTALGVLVPAAIVNVIILIMRPVRTAAAAPIGAIAPRA